MVYYRIIWMDDRESPDKEPETKIGVEGGGETGHETGQ